MPCNGSCCRTAFVSAFTTSLKCGRDLLLMWLTIYVDGAINKFMIRCNCRNLGYGLILLLVTSQPIEIKSKHGHCITSLAGSLNVYERGILS